jgi:hypothetical protein
VNRAAVLFALVGAACTGTVGADDTADPITLEIAAPTAGASVLRDQLAANGALVAAVSIDVVVTGPAARVAIAVADGAPIDADATGHAVVEVARLGTMPLTATAYDAAGAVAATAEVELTVAAPELADCHAELDLYRVEYTLGPDNKGVEDPVTATVPINGLVFRYIGNAEPRERLFGDCQLILSIARGAALLRDRGVVEIADYGVYNYRCIGGEGTPPDCPNGMSQHAFANAIDLAAFTLADATYLTVEDDWVIDPDEESTCTAATEPGADAFLHEMICALKAAGTWNIVLTPNYNSAHRDHFHVDLTPGDDFIRHRLPVDRGPDHH